MNSKIEKSYSVGALMYSPVKLHTSIVDALKRECFAKPFSLAFCLEDTVSEDAVEEAENELYHILSMIREAHEAKPFYLPMIFIRIRSPKQLEALTKRYAEFRGILSGFILPKFFVENCDAYISIMQKEQDYWYMPIFESASMIDLHTRYRDLSVVKEKLEAVSDRILNVRVGGNDLSNVFGLRRRADQTIYDMHPVSNLLVDIVTMFSDRYVVSGPVWEYYAGENWDTGMKREMELDLLNGFIGKTVIHPNQIEIVNEMLKVSAADYEDAKNILNWDDKSAWLVSASAERTRMNEYKTHWRWARKTVALAELYGIK